MAERLPDLVLPCWADDDEHVAFTAEPKGLVKVEPSASFVLLSSMSQDRLRGWLDDLAVQRKRA